MQPTHFVKHYDGFAAHTYRLTWPAPRQPDLAMRVRDLLARQDGFIAGNAPEMERAAASNHQATDEPDSFYI